MKCIHRPGLPQNWKNKMLHTHMKPDNWEAIRAHFLWTCCSIPQLEEDTEDHMDTNLGDNFDKDTDSNPQPTEEADLIDAPKHHPLHEDTISEPLQPLQ
jgi:hypothetical protein